MFRSLILVTFLTVAYAASIEKRDDEADEECTTAQALQYGVNCRRKRAALEEAARSGADYERRSGLVELAEDVGGADYMKRGLELSEEQGADYEKRGAGREKRDAEDPQSVRNMLKY